MSKKYKQKHDKIKEEEFINNNPTLSKKELYDLEKEKKIAEKEKKRKKIEKKQNKSKKNKKTYKTNLAGRIFAIVMLILMIGSVIATISYYFTSGAK